ncbi:MAG: class I SAM-dependent methyltransferase [Actinomycetota bacterium]|nr:class I SAM-dependent methyltransferase [Actinomycetota bacterium]
MDREKINEFLDTFLGFASGATTIGLLAVADRTGLSAYLGEHPTGTSEEIAEGAGLNERYVREIMSGLAAVGAVEYDAGTKAFTLPEEHALFISSELSPYFMGGWLDMLPSIIGQVDGVAEATVNGGGVAFEEFGNIVRGIDRGNGPSQRVFLTTRWLPAIPGLADRLDAGIRIADVGCGSGTAAILMAGAYPNCEVFGFDVSSESVDLAGSRSTELANVVFEQSSVEDIPTDPGFDLITTFDVIHDLTDPLAGLKRIHAALHPEGQYLMMEPKASSNLEENFDARGALLYGVSALHCMTQSLAIGGAGLGTAWGREMTEQYASDAGFTSFDDLEKISNRFSSFYLLTV